MLRKNDGNENNDNNNKLLIILIQYKISKNRTNIY